MRFKQLTIENFGPYKDREVIRFGDCDGVSIIWGDNGRGKTSIMNAFNFVFFGEVKNRKGDLHDYISFINEEGASEGRYTYQITLTVKDGASDYSITRSLELMNGVKVPRTNEDVYPVLTVKEGGYIVESGKAEHIVNSLLPKDVSRFFLFDGELLQEYEELLNDRSLNGATIKSSIEQILGLPILTYGAADAKRAVERYSTEATRAAQNDSKTAKYATQIARLKEESANHLAEIERLKAEKEEQLAEKRRLEKEMQDTEKLRAYLEKKCTIEAAIQAKEEQIQAEQESILALMKDAWTWMIVPVVQQELDELNGTVVALKDKQASARTQRRLITYLREAVDGIRCPVCEHEPTTEERTVLVERIRRIEAGTTELSAAEEEVLQNAESRMSALRPFNIYGSNRDEIRRRCETVDDLRVDISDLRDVQLAELLSDLKVLSKDRDPDDDPMIAVTLHSRCEREIGILEEGIHDEQTRVEQIDTDIYKLNKKIQGLSNSKDVLLANKRLEFVEGIQDIFAEAVGVYRDKLRDDVQRDATELFLAMSDEAEYSCLSINENYGLSIMLRDSGKAVPNRSAGWEHMVAFALIGALHKNAPFEGPIIMDFPFSRMSTKNKRNMMKAVPMLSDQVMLLVFPGEIDPSTTRQDIGRSIVQECTLQRISATHTHIERSDYNG